MASKEYLEALPPTRLAVACQKVAEDSSNAQTVADAAILKTEWFRLQTPLSPSLKEEREMDAKRRNLRKRMVDFLVGRDELDFYLK
jgi:hypothetical protein